MPRWCWSTGWSPVAPVPSCSPTPGGCGSSCSCTSPLPDADRAADERAVLDAARAVVTTSEWTRGRLVERDGVPPSRVSVSRSPAWTGRRWHRPRPRVSACSASPPSPGRRATTSCSPPSARCWTCRGAAPVWGRWTATRSWSTSSGCPREGTLDGTRAYAGDLHRHTRGRRPRRRVCRRRPARAPLPCRDVRDGRDRGPGARGPRGGHRGRRRGGGARSRDRAWAGRCARPAGRRGGAGRGPALLAGRPRTCAAAGGPPRASAAPPCPAGPTPRDASRRCCARPRHDSRAGTAGQRPLAPAAGGGRLRGEVARPGCPCRAIRRRSARRGPRAERRLRPGLRHRRHGPMARSAAPGPPALGAPRPRPGPPRGRGHGIRGPCRRWCAGHDRDASPRPDRGSSRDTSAAPRWSPRRPSWTS